MHNSNETIQFFNFCFSLISVCGHLAHYKDRNSIPESKFTFYNFTPGFEKNNSA